MKNLQTAFAALRRDARLRRRIYFSVLILFIYKFSTWILLPGVMPAALWRFKDDNSWRFIADIFSGKGYSTASLMAVSLTPYVAATILISFFQNLLFAKTTDPRLRASKINRLTIALALAFSFIQAGSYIQLLRSSPGAITPSMPDSLFWFCSTFLLMAGTAITIWLIGLNKKYGVGDGMTLLTDLGIVLVFTDAVAKGFFAEKVSAFYLLEFAFLMLVTAGIVAMRAAHLKIAYTDEAKNKQFITVKMNALKYYPIGAAMAFMFIPKTFEHYFIGSSEETGFFYIAILFAFIVVATIVQSAMTTDLNLYVGYIVAQGGAVGRKKREPALLDHFDRLFSKIALYNGVLLGIVGILPFVSARIGFNPHLAAFMGGIALYNMVDSVQEVYEDVTASG